MEMIREEFTHRILISDRCYAEVRTRKGLRLWSTEHSIASPELCERIESEKGFQTREAAERNAWDELYRLMGVREPEHFQGASVRDQFRDLREAIGEARDERTKKRAS